MELITSRHKAAAWMAQTIDESGPKLELTRALQDIARCVGARHASIVMQHVPGVVAENSLSIDTFGQAWRRHSGEHRLELSDPTRTAATVTEPLIDWADIPRDRLKTRRFMRDFQDFQLGKHGLTALHRGHLGDRSLLTLTSDVTDKRWAVLRLDIGAAMGLIHPSLHRFVLRTRYDIDGSVQIRLTPREKECLGWAAHGRTSKQIGDVLGLTPATVNFFIDAAVQKLAASNRAHAAAKAVALGLIAPPR
jgi:DNA-binding CsgD family transcriptional regulator